MDLRFQGVERGETLLFAQVTHEMQRDGGVIDLSVKVKEVHFYRNVLPIIECRPTANI